MPKVNTSPKGLRPFLFQGVNVGYEEGAEQAVGDCPLCGKEGRFYVNAASSLWDCKVCAEKGNSLTFLRRLWELAAVATTAADYDRLMRDRGLVYPETLMEWGVARSPLTDDWLVPAFSADGKMVQLYRYVLDPASGRRRLWPTPEHGHGMFGINLCDSAKPDVYVCEGPWDALAMWEALRSSKRTGEGPDSDLTATSSEGSSLLASADVVGVPGCNVFLEAWAPLFAGRNVKLMFDNDHPKPHPQTGTMQAPTGFAGTRRVAEILARGTERPKSIRYLAWGEEGWAPGLPDGCDVRDLLTADGSAGGRTAALKEILANVEPIPEAWVPGRTAEAAAAGEPDLDLITCDSWPVLMGGWRRAMKMTEGLTASLACMLATVTSTKIVGDQLWMKIIGPPSCGKSVLCEALSVNTQYVTSKSTIRGFHSGYKSDKEGKEDNSLIPKIRDKTLVTKDGDTLLQAPNRAQILAEARDLYDCTSRTHYRHGIDRNYMGVRMTWLLCGTESLRQLDSTELGERFLDCVVVDEMDDELEDEIGWRVANRVDREMAFEADGKAETREGPEMVHAKRLTGGYISYLRRNARDLLEQVRAPEQALRRCQRLAKFVSFMRARPSKAQEEKAQRELSFRLISQVVRLAKCLAVVLNRKELDEDVLRIVTKVATDTARGRTLELVRNLARAGYAGAETRQLALWTNETEDKERQMLRFLRKIGAVELFTRQLSAGLSGSPRWRLAPKMARLYSEVFPHEVIPTEDY
jgi:hypothetical protein